MPLHSGPPPTRNAAQGLILRRLRRASGLSARAAAEALHMEPRTYKNFESGRGPATPARILAFARLMNADPAALVLAVAGLNPLLALACARNKAITIALATIEDIHAAEPGTLASLTGSDLVGAFAAAGRALSETGQARSRRRGQTGRSGERLISARQLECLRWAQAGKSSTDIGAILDISPRTVDSYLALTCARLGVRTRVQAISLAIELGLLSPRPP